MKQILTFLLLFSLVLRLLGSEPVQLAVLGEGETAARLSALLPESLTEPFELVERQEIDAILRERDLSLHQLTGEQIYQLLLPADLIAILESMESENNAPCYLTVFETAHGLRLYHRQLPDTTVEAIRTVLQTVLQRRKNLDSDNLVTISAVRNTGVGVRFQNQFFALEEQLSDRLQSIPEILFVEREYLDRLIQEKHLTAREFAVAAAARLIRLEFSTNDDGSGFLTRLQVTDGSGQELFRCDSALTGLQLVDFLMNELTNSLKLPPPPPVEPAVEAQRYFNEYKHLRDYNRPAAIKKLSAALALNPAKIPYRAWLLLELQEQAQTPQQCLQALQQIDLVRSEIPYDGYIYSFAAGRQEEIFHFLHHRLSAEPDMVSTSEKELLPIDRYRQHERQRIFVHLAAFNTPFSLEQSQALFGTSPAQVPSFGQAAELAAYCALNSRFIRPHFYGKNEDYPLMALQRLAATAAALQKFTGTENALEKYRPSIYFAALQNTDCFQLSLSAPAETALNDVCRQFQNCPQADARSFGLLLKALAYRYRGDQQNYRRTLTKAVEESVAFFQELAQTSPYFNYSIKLSWSQELDGLLPSTNQAEIILQQVLAENAQYPDMEKLFQLLQPYPQLVHADNFLSKLPQTFLNELRLSLIYDLQCWNPAFRLELLWQNRPEESILAAARGRDDGYFLVGNTHDESSPWRVMHWSTAGIRQIAEISPTTAFHPVTPLAGRHCYLQDFHLKYCDNYLLIGRNDQLAIVELASGQVNYLTNFPGEWLIECGMMNGRIYLFSGLRYLFSCLPDGSGRQIHISLNGDSQSNLFDATEANFFIWGFGTDSRRNRLYFLAQDDASNYNGLFEFDPATNQARRVVDLRNEGDIHYLMAVENQVSSSSDEKFVDFSIVGARKSNGTYFQHCIIFRYDIQNETVSATGGWGDREVVDSFQPAAYWGKTGNFGPHFLRREQQLWLFAPSGFSDIVSLTNYIELPGGNMPYLLIFPSVLELFPHPDGISVVAVRAQDLIKITPPMPEAAASPGNSRAAVSQ